MISRVETADGHTQVERQRRFDAFEQLHREWVAGVDQDYVARAAQIQAMSNSHETIVRAVSHEDELGLGGEDEPVRHIVDPKQLAAELEVLWIKSNLPQTTPTKTKTDDKTSSSAPKTSSSAPKYSAAQTQAQTQQETRVCRSKNTFSPEHMDDFLAEIAAWGQNRRRFW